MLKILNKFNILQKNQPTQRGAVLMVMLVILIVGGSALLLNSLSNTSLRTERDKITADALAQAKEALIGRAISDANSPGSLPCPDTFNDGSSGPLAGNDCVSYIGRLPWKSLGLPDLRDGSGERLWYALSKNFRDHSSSNPINSDTPGSLTITGSLSANEIAAIVFSPGANANDQSRSDTQTAACLTTSSTVTEDLCATNYLEGSNANPSLAAAPNTLYTTSNTSNDQLNHIKPENLLPKVEKRIAREVKNCLDDYASTSGQKYPWAAPVSPLSYNSTPNTLFGRIPDHPSDSVIRDMLDKISTLQTSVNNCALTDNSANQTALVNAGLNLSIAAALVATSQPTAPAIPTTVTVPAKTAGDRAQDSGRCANILADPPNDIVQTNLNTVNIAISSITGIYWPASCTLITSPYWTTWKELVFYQIANGYKPNSAASCISGCLSIIGSGNSNIGSGTYRAVLAIAGKSFSSQSRPSSANPPIDYLSNSTSEGSTVSGLVPNAHSSVNPTTTFKTYNLSDPDYKNINDLVLCLDGKSNCK